MPLLELRAVGAHYGDRVALHDVSLSVEEGEAVALLGENGSGKTTVLRAVSGAVATSGEILYDGERSFHRTPESMARKGVVHVPQGRGTFATLTVLDNLRLGAWVHQGGSPRALANVYERFPVLYERRDERAGALPVEEQQLLALGRAMMARPRLLLVDEPSLGLAPAVSRIVFDVLASLNAAGAAILVAEQHPPLALRVAHRSYVLAGGTIAA